MRAPNKHLIARVKNAAFAALAVGAFPFLAPVFLSFGGGATAYADVCELTLIGKSKFLSAHPVEQTRLLEALTADDVPALVSEWGNEQMLREGSKASETRIQNRVRRLVQASSLVSDEQGFLDELRGAILAAELGGPRVLDFGISVDPTALRPRAYAIETQSLYKNGDRPPVTLHHADAEALARKGRAEMSVAARMAELFWVAIGRGILPAHPNFVIGPRGGVAWIDSANWSQVKTPQAASKISPRTAAASKISPRTAAAIARAWVEPVLNRADSATRESLARALVEEALRRTEYTDGEIEEFVDHLAATLSSRDGELIRQHARTILHPELKIGESDWSFYNGREWRRLARHDQERAPNLTPNLTEEVLEALREGFGEYHHQRTTSEGTWAEGRVELPYAEVMYVKTPDPALTSIDLREVARARFQQRLMHDAFGEFRQETPNALRDRSRVALFYHAEFGGEQEIWGVVDGARIEALRGKGLLPKALENLPRDASRFNRSVYGDRLRLDDGTLDRVARANRKVRGRTWYIFRSKNSPISSQVKNVGIAADERAGWDHVDMDSLIFVVHSDGANEPLLMEVTFDEMFARPDLPSIEIARLSATEEAKGAGETLLQTAATFAAGTLQYQKTYAQLSDSRRDKFGRPLRLVDITELKSGGPGGSHVMGGSVQDDFFYGAFEFGRSGALGLSKWMTVYEPSRSDRVSARLFNQRLTSRAGVK